MSDKEKLSSAEIFWFWFGIGWGILLLIETFPFVEKFLAKNMELFLAIEWLKIIKVMTFTLVCTSLLVFLHHFWRKRRWEKAMKALEGKRNSNS